MLKKIISGGQTGADQAALDVAIKFNIPHGGWIPKGRKTEAGSLPEKYQLTEMETADYRERTKKNIEMSTGTAIISRGDLTGGSKLTRTHARVVSRPHIYLDLLTTDDFEAAIFLKSFVLENQIQVLNVAGPRLSHSPWIYNDVKTLMETTFYLLYLDAKHDQMLKEYLPTSFDSAMQPEFLGEAVELITQDLQLKTKVFIARTKDVDILPVYFLLLDYIRSRVGFDIENKMLLKDCRLILADPAATVEDGVMLILKSIKKSLEDTYLLRLVK